MSRVLRRTLAALLMFVCAGLSAQGLEFPDTIAKVKPSIVAVGTYQKTRNPPFIFRGTGFIVGDGTVIATNAHVLPEKLASEAGETLVFLAPSVGGLAQGREAKQLAVDVEHDLALLKLAGAPLPALELGDSSTVREGQVFGFTGFPLETLLGLTAVTHRGMISALPPIVLPRTSATQLDAKTIMRLKAGPFIIFQLDGTAYPGNSGSPVYETTTGRVIGIINAVFVRGNRDEALKQPTGISYAIPAQYLRNLLTQQH
jgi:S1-C subfamily serine protease